MIPSDIQVTKVDQVPHALWQGDNLISTDILHKGRKDMES